MSASRPADRPGYMAGNSVATARLGGPTEKSTTNSGEDALDYVTMNVGQATLDPVVIVVERLVV